MIPEIQVGEPKKPANNSRNLENAQVMNALALNEYLRLASETISRRQKNIVDTIDKSTTKMIWIKRNENPKNEMVKSSDGVETENPAVVFT